MSFFTRNVIRWHVTRYIRLLDGVDVYLVIMNENTLFRRTLFRSNYRGLRGIDSKNRSEDRFFYFQNQSSSSKILDNARGVISEILLSLIK